MKAKRPVRHVVLDNEAAAKLLGDRTGDVRRRAVVRAVSIASGRKVAPTAVRAESGWDRRSPRAAEANLLVGADDSFDPAAADRAVELRKAVPSASVVDTAVAVAAERAGRVSGGPVLILTSDEPDLRALADELKVATRILRI